MNNLQALGRAIGRDVKALAGRGEGLVVRLVAYGWVWSVINNRAISTGIDKAVDTVKDEGCPVTEGFFKKAVSYAKAVATHGKVNGVDLKAVQLVGEEGEMIEQALSHLKGCSVSAAVNARVASNKGKAAPRKAEPGKSVDPSTAATEGPQGDPIEAAATAATTAIQALIEAGATDHLARLTAMLLAAAQGAEKKAA